MSPSLRVSQLNASPPFDFEFGAGTSRGHYCCPAGRDGRREEGGRERERERRKRLEMQRRNATLKGWHESWPIRPPPPASRSAPAGAVVEAGAGDDAADRRQLTSNHTVKIGSESTIFFTVYIYILFNFLQDLTLGRLGMVQFRRHKTPMYTRL